MQMTWVHHEKRRYYAVHVVKDLFDTWCVVCEWGSLDSRRGRWITSPVAARADGVRQVGAIAKRRQARGYRLVDGGAGR